MDVRLQIKRAQQGDPQALENVCQAIKPVVCRCFRRAHLRVLGEDAQIIGWIAALEALQNYDFRGNIPFTAYVGSHVRFALWNFFKKERKIWQRVESYDNLSSEESRDAAIPLLVDPRDSATEALRHMDSAQLKRSIAELPPRQRTVIALFAVGTSLTAIGQKLAISPQAVYQLKKRALSRLKRDLHGMV